MSSSFDPTVYGTVSNLDQDLISSFNLPEGAEIIPTIYRNDVPPKEMVILDFCGIGIDEYLGHYNERHEPEMIQEILELKARDPERFARFGVTDDDIRNGSDKIWLTLDQLVERFGSINEALGAMDKMFDGYYYSNSCDFGFLGEVVTDGLYINNEKYNRAYGVMVQASDDLRNAGITEPRIIRPDEVREIFNQDFIDYWVEKTKDQSGGTVTDIFGLGINEVIFILNWAYAPKPVTQQ